MFNKKTVFLALASLSVSPLVSATHPQINFEQSDTTITLCNEKEDIYFNAQLENKKYVSLCGYRHKSPNTGYVKYRYGTSNDIELEFPKDKDIPKGRFLSYHIRLGKVQGRAIFFYIGNYRYSIANVAGRCSLIVYKNKTVMFESFCEKESELKTFNGIPSGLLITDEQFIKRFPQQYQDPSEPEFH